MKRKLFLILLVAMLSMMFVACASSKAPADPAKDEATALFEEVNTLKAECEAAGLDKTAGKWGRAESIYFLGSTYFEKEMYTESLQPLGQAKTYFTGFLGK